MGLPAPFRHPPSWESPLGRRAPSSPLSAATVPCRWAHSAHSFQFKRTHWGEFCRMHRRNPELDLRPQPDQSTWPRCKCEGQKALGTWRASEVGGGRGSLRVPLLCGPGLQGFEARPEVWTWAGGTSTAPLGPLLRSPTRPPALSDFPGESSSEGLGQSRGLPGQLADRASLGLRAGPRRPGGR